MDAKPTENIEAIWDQLAKEFRNWNGVKPRASWIKTGLSERAGYNRLRILEGGRQAKLYFSLTKDLAGRELNYLHRRAEVNLEQAVVAARLATILNLTVFIGALVIFNQLFPGLIAKYALGMMQGGDAAAVIISIFTIALFFATVIGVLSYSHGGTAQARDLKHLLELSLARRALRGSDGKEDENAGLDTDLRENFISDF